MILIVYRVARFVLAIFLKVFFRIKVEGIKNLPSNGAAVLCSNHISWLDPPLLAVFIPRMIHFVAKKELFEYPVLGIILEKAEVIPVRRGQSDRHMVKRAINVLQNEKVLGLFPEGTRQRDKPLSTFTQGAAYLANRCEVPIIPVGVSGRYGLFSQVYLQIGKPIDVQEIYSEENEELKSRRTVVNELSELIRNRMGDLVK